MDTHVIEVEKRDGRGKGEARKMRRAGKLPGVLYGHKEEAVALTVDPVMLEKHLRHSGKKRNTLFELSGLDRKVLALPKDVQTDPIKRHLLHVDFLEVREGDRVDVEIPLVYTGRPVGVVKGGKLEGTRRTLKLNCSPLNIPAAITLEVSHLEIGDTVSVKDLPLPEGAVAALEANLTVATVRAPRKEAAETTEEETDEAPAEEA